MTDAELTVDDSEMLSVEALNLELNSEAARDFFLAVVDRMDGSVGTGSAGGGIALPGS